MRLINGIFRYLSLKVDPPQAGGGERSGHLAGDGGGGGLGEWLELDPSYALRSWILNLENRLLLFTKLRFMGRTTFCH